MSFLETLSELLRQKMFTKDNMIESDLNFSHS